jgi:hypothetical protein
MRSRINWGHIRISHQRDPTSTASIVYQLSMSCTRSLSFVLRSDDHSDKVCAPFMKCLLGLNPYYRRLFLLRQLRANCQIHPACDFRISDNPTSAAADVHQLSCTRSLRFLVLRKLEVAILIKSAIHQLSFALCLPVHFSPLPSPALQPLV